MASEQRASPFRLQLASTFRSLQYRNYRLFFSGQILSLIGTWIQRVALPWLVYRMTGSAVLLGVVGFAGQIPTFLLAPVAGVITDRFDRYTILIATQILAMAQALTLAVLFFTGTIAVWHIIVLAVTLGMINAFDMPSRQALVIDMVDKREDLGNAIALNSSMVNAARLIGPSIAGILIAVTNEGVCFLVNGLSYGFVIVSLVLMRFPTSRRTSLKTHILPGLRQGFTYAFGSVPIRAIILLLATISLMGMPYTVLMPIFAAKVLHGGSYAFGFLMGAAGTGALVGALFLASRKSVLGLGRIIVIAATLFGLSLVAFSLSRVFWVSLALMVFAGMGLTVQMASSNTIIQTIVDDDKRGRVMSLYMMAFIGTAPFGSLLAGALADRIGAPETLMIGGTVCAAGALWFGMKLTTIRDHIRPIYRRLGILPAVAETPPQVAVPEE